MDHVLHIIQNLTARLGVQYNVGRWKFIWEFLVCIVFQNYTYRQLEMQNNYFMYHIVHIIQNLIARLRFDKMSGGGELIGGFSFVLLSNNVPTKN
jgi:hypothetical protein